jgi:acyl transferase domain-containing protein
VTDLETRYRKTVAALKRAVDRLQAVRAARHEPLAVVGMACRLPGGVDTPEAFWDALAAGRELVGPLPASRAYRQLPPDLPAPRGGFLDRVDTFDAAFFGIAPREAAWMDPQQRLVLETAWEAIEHAALRPSTLRGTTTGVFVGTSGSDYTFGADAEKIEGYALTGSAVSVLAGRISYVLGLQGPCFSVDTACSGSLVAMHLAAMALRARQCELALVGGVTLMNTPGALAEFARMGASSSDGRCRSFAAEADGAGWAEGCGMVLLATRAEAERRGLPVLGWLRGTAINHDGRSQGLTAPNGPSQQRVIRAALADADLTPDDIDHIEAHGTGTPLGDPIEAGSLAAVFAGRDRPLWLGSAKSTVAHNQAAAAVTGLIKVLLSLQHDTLPATLHAAHPSPQVAWQDGPLALLQQARPWPRGDRPRRAGISSFGISGTNGHMVVEEARPAPSRAGGGLLLLSARSPQALGRLTARTARRLDDTEAVADLRHTAAHHRTAEPHRLALPADDRHDLRRRLRAVAEDDATLATRAPSVVFLFSGQGGQWVGMARELLAEDPDFRDAFLRADAAIARVVGWSVAAQLDADALGPIDRVQPVLFAVAVGLAASWQAAGVTPDVVVGHSQGEVAAAVVGGQLSMDDAATVIGLRSRLLRRIAGQGAIALVDLDAAEAADAVAAHPALSVAADNGPGATVIAGTPDAVDALVAGLQADDRFARRIEADVAAHSAQVDPLLPELRALLSDLRPRAGTVPLHSTVDGTEDAVLDADYWARNLRDPVRLHEVLAACWERGPTVVVEISPHPVLAAAADAVRTSVDGLGGVVVSQRRDKPQGRLLRQALGEAWCHGVELDLDRVAPGRRTHLPPTPFDGRRHWRPEGRAAAASLHRTPHPWLPS